MKAARSWLLPLGLALLPVIIVSAFCGYDQYLEHSRLTLGNRIVERVSPKVRPGNSTVFTLPSEEDLEGLRKANDTQGRIGVGKVFWVKRSSDDRLTLLWDQGWNTHLYDSRPPCDPAEAAGALCRPGNASPIDKHWWRVVSPE